MEHMLNTKALLLTAKSLVFSIAMAPVVVANTAGTGDLREKGTPFREQLPIIYVPVGDSVSIKPAYLPTVVCEAADVIKFDVITGDILQIDECTSSRVGWLKL